MSCANIIRQFATLGIVTQHTYKDPSLTNCAIQHAHVLGKMIREALAKQGKNWTSPLMVFSSVLVRAMETALYNFPEEKVYPIPFIAEHDTFRDNMPLDWLEQQHKLQRPPNAFELLNHLSFDSHVNPPNDPDRDGEFKDDYTLFKQEFPKILDICCPRNM